MSKTQLQKIERHLLKGKSITSFGAFMRFRITRLSAYIYLLRKRGYPIITTRPQMINGKTFAKYYIDKEWLRERRHEKSI